MGDKNKLSFWWDSLLGGKNQNRITQGSGKYPIKENLNEVSKPWEKAYFQHAQALRLLGQADSILDSYREAKKTGKDYSLDEPLAKISEALGILELLSGNPHYTKGSNLSYQIDRSVKRLRTYLPKPEEKTPQNLSALTKVANLEARLQAAHDEIIGAPKSGWGYPFERGLGLKFKFIIPIVAGGLTLFFMSPSVTGNAIGSLNNSTTTGIGLLCFAACLGGLLFWTKSKNKSSKNIKKVSKKKARRK